jgi:hypothetical protein
MHTIYTAVPPKIESSVFLFHKCNPITAKTAIPVAIVPLPGLLMLSLMQYTTNTAIIAGGNDSDTFCTVEGILCFPPKSKNGNARSKKVVIAAIPIKIKSYIVWFIFFLSFFCYNRAEYVIYKKRRLLMNTNLPNDPVILVSYLNTQLRDFYSSLDELCKAFDIKKDAVEQKLAAIDYHYNAGLNQFQ